jgi:hypothetical protein
MSDDTKKKTEAVTPAVAPVTRRDTLKLATALSALGVGLGVTLREGEAHAETHKIDTNSVGLLTLKFYKEVVGKPAQLLHTADLSSYVIKGEAGRYFLKLENLKVDQSKVKVADVIASHTLEVVQQKW